jgi:hypothetical protein
MATELPRLVFSLVECAKTHSNEATAGLAGFLGSGLVGRWAAIKRRLRITTSPLTRAGDLTLSGRTPMPTIPAGIRRKNGTWMNNRTNQGGLILPVLPRTREITRLWMKT